MKSYFLTIILFQETIEVYEDKSRSRLPFSKSYLKNPQFCFLAHLICYFPVSGFILCRSICQMEKRWYNIEISWRLECTLILIMADYIFHIDDLKRVLKELEYILFLRSCLKYMKCWSAPIYTYIYIYTLFIYLYDIYIFIFIYSYLYIYI